MNSHIDEDGDAAIQILYGQYGRHLTMMTVRECQSTHPGVGIRESALAIINGL